MQEVAGSKTPAGPNSSLGHGVPGVVVCPLWQEGRKLENCKRLTGSLCLNKVIVWYQLSVESNLRIALVLHYFTQ